MTKGDRVAGFLPNIAEALIAMLATTSMGAIWSSCSPDFGPHSVIDRLAQITPKVLFAVGGYRYGGKDFGRAGAVAEIVAGLPGLAALITVAARPDLGARHPGVSPPRVGPAPGAAGQPEPQYEEVPFGHPLWVLYSSGTTGLPKAIVHGHGGIVLEHLKALSLHQDLGPGGVFFWYTTTGWMMWNYLAGGLLAGATVLLYDGSADLPGHRRAVAAGRPDRVTYFGTGAPYLLACAKAGLSPGRELDLSAMRGIGSTGSPLPPEGFDWVYQRGRHRTCCSARSPAAPTCAPGSSGPTRCSRCGPASSPAAAWAPRSRRSTSRASRSPAQVGELVITEPMPSMPVGFWNDPGGERYRASYFATYPGVWRHGDWITMLPDGGCVIYGRSDATLNRGGVRMGTSEFYRVVERLPEITDSLVVDTGQLGSPGRLVLYVVLADGCAPGRRAGRADPRRAARRAVAAACAGRDPPGARRAAHAVRQETRGTGAQDPARHPGGPGRRPGRAGQPGGAGAVREPGDPAYSRDECSAATRVIEGIG